ncbi:ABC transporter permease [Streptococcus sp. DD12]|uniref:ABC transporter permease n=1 Tax=Streptococcus sp. DD12 TaxID=1777880 RepID=UPI0007972135|nr:ABC transporter permease [Streptococcus sp. DD12]KXT75860.1 ABC transporter membrane-spanning permease - Na+ export [Streptococcus sp. DD12]
MTKVWTVFSSGYKRQVRSWSFVFMVLSPFLFIGISFAGNYFAKNAQSDTIAVVSQDNQVNQVFKEKVFKSYTSQEKAKDALDSDDIMGYLLITQDEGHYQATYRAKQRLSANDKLLINGHLQTLQVASNVARAQLSVDQVTTLQDQAQLVEKVSAKENTDSLAKTISFYGMVAVLYILLLFYSANTAQEIASEKGTKIMEVVFSSMKASTYFYSRLLVVAAVIVTQLVIYALGAVLTYQVASRLPETKDWLQQFQPLLQAVLKHFDLINLLFIIFGLIIYVALSALCGAIVARPEDANKASQPVLYLVMLGLFGSIYLGQSNSLIVSLGSFVPFLSSFFMPIRVINGFASQGEALVSLAILVLATFALVGFIGRSYSGLILQTDDLGLWQSFKRGLTRR